MGTTKVNTSLPVTPRQFAIEAKNKKELIEKINSIVDTGTDGTSFLLHSSCWIGNLPTYKVNSSYSEDYFIWKDCPKFKNGRFIVE